MTSTPSGAPMRRLSDRALVGLAAVCCCVTVGNIYLALPLLTLMAKDLGVGVGAIGVVATASQVGYALGLFLFIPLGDVVRHRPLVGVLLGGTAVGLTLAALALSLPELALATFAFSALTVTAHVLIPFLMNTVAERHQARAVATVQAGITAGIILSRVAGGSIGEYLGWRSVYAISAIATALVAIALVVFLPRQERMERVSYPRLLGSTLALLAREPLLRWSCALQGITFGAFNLVWTSVVLLLTEPPYRLSVAEAGLFGLLGLATVIAAPWQARAVDRWGPSITIPVGQCVLLLGTIVFAFSKLSLVFVVIGSIVLYVGNQSSQMANQLRALRLLPTARSRVNMLFMTSTFLGGAMGSLISTAVFAGFGWLGVTTASTVLALGSSTIALASRRRLEPRVPVATP